MQHPDRLLSLHRDGTLTSYDCQEAATRRPVLSLLRLSGRRSAPGKAWMGVS
jgi:hypothetical protein